MRTVLVAYLSLIGAVPAAAQELSIGGGPTWRGTVRGFGLGSTLNDGAAAIDVTFSKRAAALGWSAGLG